MQEIPTGLTRSSAQSRSTTLVVAVAIVAADGKICMQQRPYGKNHGGLWEFPGGKVEKGEHPRTALVREIAEELGASLNEADLLPAGFAESPSDEGGAGMVILLYACRAWTGEVRCLEGEAIAWVAPDHIADLAMPPLDYPLAASLRELLSTGSF